jgi:uncharacterized Zn ribbon protein
MKKSLAAASALALTLALGLANAAQTEGKIDKVSSDHTWFTLNDGTQFSLAKGVSVKGLKPGTEVKVTYETHEGKNVASKVAKVHTKTSKPTSNEGKKSY